MNTTFSDDIIQMTVKNGKKSVHQLTTVIWQASSRCSKTGKMLSLNLLRSLLFAPDRSAKLSDISTITPPESPPTCSTIQQDLCDIKNSNVVALLQHYHT